MQSIILTSRYLFFVPHHNDKKLFQLALFCLLAVLVFEVIVYDGDFTNDDSPFQVSQSGVALTGDHIKTRLVRHFGGILYLPIIEQKVHPGDTEELKGAIDIYLLFGDYTFKIGKWEKVVSKVYMYGTTGESFNETKVNKSIANERLKLDYQRLKEVNIHFEEKYF